MHKLTRSAWSLLRLHAFTSTRAPAQARPQPTRPVRTLFLTAMGQTVQTYLGLRPRHRAKCVRHRFVAIYSTPINIGNLLNRGTRQAGTGQGIDGTNTEGGGGNNDQETFTSSPATVFRTQAVSYAQVAGSDADWQQPAQGDLLGLPELYQIQVPHPPAHHQPTFHRPVPHQPQYTQDEIVAAATLLQNAANSNMVSSPLITPAPISYAAISTSLPMTSEPMLASLGIPRQILSTSQPATLTFGALPNTSSLTGTRPAPVFTLPAKGWKVPMPDKFSGLRTAGSRCLDYASHKVH